MNALPTSLLQRLLERPAPFALLYRPESNGPGLLDVIRGEALELHGLADLPLDEPGPGLPRHDLLALIPYRQIAERDIGGRPTRDQADAEAVTALLEQMNLDGHLGLTKRGGQHQGLFDRHGGVVHGV